jgi:hypothetical protein
MKKTYLVLTMLLGVFTLSNAQVTVEVDANAAWLGFANVFETQANGGAFVFGQPWGVPDLKTVIDTGAGTITLQPNFNTWNPADPFWVTPAGEPNKVFEGNTYVEDNTLLGQTVTFTGNCDSFTIDPGYAVKAYIKVFQANFSIVKEESTMLEAGQNFSVEFTDVEAEDEVVQYGFQVLGLIADPADEPTLGSVVVQAPILSVGDVDAVNVAAFPNPTTDVVTIQASEPITSITLYSVVGQQILVVSPNQNTTELDMSGLQSGLYIASIQSDSGNKSIRLVKN